MQVTGSIPIIIRNDEGLYEGNLIQYFRVVFYQARNLFNPYHNFRHMFHVLWLCYQACKFYKDKLTPREMRNLLIAAMFHDFGHSGSIADDDINILVAKRGLERCILEEDKPYLDEIERIMDATEYPHKVPSEELHLTGQIIRDADLSQTMSAVWIQQAVFGLAQEWGQKPIEVLRQQGPFISSLKFFTKWARQTFPQSDIAEKLREVEELLSLLE